MKINRLSFFIVFMLIITCGNQEHSISYKPDPNFINAYIELLMLHEKLDYFSPAYEDSSIQILKKHHLTQPQYTHKLDELNNKPERWEVFLQQVLDQMQSKENIHNENLSDREKNIFNRAVK